MSDQQAFYETVQRQEEFEADEKKAADAEFQKAMLAKWPGVLLWPKPPTQEKQE